MGDTKRHTLRFWPGFDPGHLKDSLRDHPALKLMDVVAERDAAFAERDTAIAEKKTANAERDAALLQRDVAYADRNAAWMERDSAIATLAMVRANRSYPEAAEKLMQMINISVNGHAMDANIRAVPKAANNLSNHQDYKPPNKPKQHGEKSHKDSKKRKASMSINRDSNELNLFSKEKHKQDAKHEAHTKVKHKKDQSLNAIAFMLPFDATAAPVPYCSCTGTNQQCYRWGKGGWQSACCTNFLSTYPLPTNPMKRNSRVPGRKMTGGAFRKILQILATDGFDITLPVDLKDHWAKHGTNSDTLLRGLEQLGTTMTLHDTWLLLY